MKLDLSVLNTGIYEYPEFAEKRGKNYIQAGANNQYFEYLFELFNTSAIHNAIVNGTADMIAGRGTYAEDWEKNDGTKEAWLRLNDLFGGDLVYKSALDLKLYGQYYWCLTWNQARTRITSVQHMPAHTMRSGIADEKGHVSEYLYKSDWTDKREKEKVYAAFDLKDRTAPQVVYQVKRYSPKYHYYGIPDYIGATNYVELDRQISSFHLNNVKNGMFPGWAINFRNGIPTDEEREAIERKVKAKFQGPEAAGNIIITFNEGADTTPELTALESNGNHDMFQYLSEELNNKILSGHRVTSPLLFGVRGGNGFGSNADELATAYDIFNRTVISPFQQIITKSVKTVLAVSEQPLSIEVLPQAPASSLDPDTTSGDNSYNGAQIQAAVAVLQNVAEGLITQEQAIVFLVQMLQFSPEVAESLFDITKDATEELAKLHKCSSDCEHVELSADVADWLISQGEEVDENEWELIDERRVDYDTEDQHNALWAFASVPKSNPAKGSEQDGDIIKVRYRYEGTTAKDSREFCRKMWAAKKVYRKEDIDAASQQVVNPGFGPNGSDKVNIWLYKGGPNCYHYWGRRTYLRKNNEQISVNEARRIIQALPVDERAANRLPQNDPRVAQRPIDMPNQGYLNPR